MLKKILFLTSTSRCDFLHRTMNNFSHINSQLFIHLSALLSPLRDRKLIQKKKFANRRNLSSAEKETRNKFIKSLKTLSIPKILKFIHRKKNYVKFSRHKLKKKKNSWKFIGSLFGLQSDVQKERRLRPPSGNKVITIITHRALIFIFPGTFFTSRVSISMLAR